MTERLAGLTSWSRAVVQHHMKLWLRLPSGSLEMHNVGLELVEDGMDEVVQVAAGQADQHRDDRRAMNDQMAAPGPWTIVDDRIDEPGGSITNASRGAN